MAAERTLQRRSGRPRVAPGEESAQASVKLPVSVYDEYVRIARARSVPLSRVLRDTLTAVLKRKVDNSQALPAS